MSTKLVVSFLAVASVVLSQTEAPPLYSPARFLRGKTPVQSPLASAGGVTLIELHLAPSGIVTEAVVLDESAPYTELIQKAAILWQFRPAEENGSAVASRVLVMGVFRPPVLMGTALPEPTSSSSPSENVPYPVGPVPVPEYPPNALYEGVAMVELEIDDAGTVVNTKMLSPEQGFDQTVLEAAARLHFKPARNEGRPAASFALVFYGFRQPILTPGLPRR